MNINVAWDSKLEGLRQEQIQIESDKSGLTEIEIAIKSAQSWWKLVKAYFTAASGSFWRDCWVGLLNFLFEIHLSR